MVEHLAPPKKASEPTKMARSNPGELQPGEPNGKVTVYPDGSKRVDN